MTRPPRESQWRWACVAGAMLCAVTAHAQPLSSTRAAVCVVPASPTETLLPDTAEITGVVVRFTANPTGRDGDAHLAKALSVLTADRLQTLIEAPVRSRYDVAPKRGNTRASNAIAEGRVLGLRWVVTGRVERRKDSVFVTWNVLDSFSGRTSGTGESANTLVQLHAITKALSASIARSVGATDSAANSGVVRPAGKSIAAFELYLAGLYPFDSFNPDEQRVAVDALQRAVALEPTLQPAWFALAESLTKLVEWGEGGSAYGRQDRSLQALTAANRALALLPLDARTLALIAHIHLLRDEPVAATQAIAGVERVAPHSDNLPWLRMELAQLQGDQVAMTRTVSSDLDQQARSPEALYVRAEWARRQGMLVDACQSLNRLIVLEPAWAPAYVQRALVRTALGDRRGGWQDAEMATRLGQPIWGNLVSALIDYSVSDSLRTRARLRSLPAVDSSSVLPVVDVMLRGAVWKVTGQTERASNVLNAAPCDDPRRRTLSDDPLLAGLASVHRCRSSAGASLFTPSTP